MMDGEGRVAESGAVSEGRVVDGEGRVAESGAVSEGRMVDGEGRVADCGAVSKGRVAESGAVSEGRVAVSEGRVVDGEARVAELECSGQLCPTVVDSSSSVPALAHTAASSSRASCPVCSRCMAVTRAGVLRVHGPLSNRCEGSGISPSSRPLSSLRSSSESLAPLLSPSGASIAASAPSATEFLQSTVVTGPAVEDAPPLGLVSLPSLHFILSVTIPTLRHVPKGARDVWAGVVGDVFRAISGDPSNLDGWAKFFMLSRCILANPERGGRCHWRDTVRIVHARIRRWKEGDIMGLWSEVGAVEDRLHHRRGKPRKLSPVSLRAANARRARRAIEDGQYKKAMQALSSDGLAPASAEVYSEMLAKHPQATPPSSIGSSPESVQITADGIVSSLKSFPSGSAPGPSCLRASHLKEAVFCSSPDRANFALLGLLGVVNLLCAGQAPPEVIPHLCGATLFACKKKGGGFRPIAVGEVLRRLTSKCISRSVRYDAFNILSRLQLGVGVPVGCEAIVHAVARVQEDVDIPPEERWILLLDFSNAFNRIDRGSMFQEVRARIPSVAAWLESCYGAQPILRLGERIILSCCGVQQGDPLGPLGFSLALHPIVEKIQEQVPGLLINAWYLDDGTLCGSAKDLHTALNIIEEEGPARGLHLNRAKSLLHIPEDSPSAPYILLADIPISQGGFNLLGSPIGPSSHCEVSVLKRVKKVEEILTRLPDLQDSQMEATLLRSCLALPKVAFALRTCPPSKIKGASEAFDNALRGALSDLAGAPLSDWAWLKASLPCSLGGSPSVRLPFMLQQLSSALWSSLTISLARFSVAPLMTPPIYPLPWLIWLRLLQNLSGSPSMTWIFHSSRSVSHSIDQANYDHLITSAQDTRSKALALSTAIPHAGDWLSVVPSQALGLHLQDWEFRLCLQYWLGLQMVSEGTSCPICQAEADPQGDHQVGCGGNGDRIFRHDSIRDALFSAAHSAALAPRKEVPALIPGSSSRPADIYLPNWRRGQPSALDVTVISSLQRMTLEGAATTQGFSLAVGKERKMAAHSAACHSVGVSFIPLVVEALGGWDEEAVATIRSVGRLLGQRVGIPPAESSRHLFQRLAIALWRGNAALWIHRLPSRPPEVDGVI